MQCAFLLSFFWVQRYLWNLRLSWKLLESDTLNPDRLIWISNVNIFNCLLHSLFSLFFEIPIPDFDQWELILSLKGAQKFQFPGLRLALRDSAYDTLLVKCYQLFWKQTLKIRLILRLIKRGDQALISISTVLKCSGLVVVTYHIILILEQSL